MSDKNEIRELLEWLKVAIPDALKHQRMSPDTRAELESVKVQIQKNNMIDAEISAALKHLVSSIDDIKTDLRTMSAVYVSRSEFDLTIKNVNDKFAPLMAGIYKAAGAVLLAVLGAIMTFFLKT